MNRDHDSWCGSWGGSLFDRCDCSLGAQQQLDYANQRNAEEAAKREAVERPIREAYERGKKEATAEAEKRITALEARLAELERRMPK